MSALSVCWTTFDHQLSFCFVGVICMWPDLCKITGAASVSHKSIQLWHKKRVPWFSQLWSAEIFTSFLCCPLRHTNKPLRHIGTVWMVWLSHRETGLQLKAEMFPLGRGHVPRFLHCGRNLWFPAICQGLFSLFLCTSSLFPHTLLFQLVFT